MSATGFARPPEDRYFEDYIPGDIHEFGSISVDEDEVLEFGRRYVPLSYHVDREAAKSSTYGGVIASSWHTAALMMRLYTENYLSKVADLGSPGGDEVRWDKPVFPGDELSVRATVLGSAPIRIPPRPRDRAHVYRGAKSKTRSRHEPENGQFREQPRFQVTAGVFFSLPAVLAPESMEFDQASSASSKV
jgi:acyl dehydratase